MSDDEAELPKVGTEVEIRDLIGRKCLNGLTGTVVSHEDITRRCRVKLHGADGIVVKVMPENLVPWLIPSASYEAESKTQANMPSLSYMGFDDLPTSLKMVTTRAPKEGTEVVFRDLVGRKHLNGLSGTVVSHCDGSREDITRRCRVQVHGAEGITVKVMPENIVPLSSFQRDSNILSTFGHLTDMGIDLLPTSIKLNLDKADDDITNAMKKSLAESSMNKSKMNTPRNVLFPRDPSRLRYLGLSFFRDAADDGETHPASSASRRRRAIKTKGVHDWRDSSELKYRDPWTIPSDQGGFAPNDDSTDRVLPTHPRLRSLLVGEEEEVQESSGWKQISLYTSADHFTPVQTKSTTQRKAKGKASRNRADELFRGRVALSVKPVDERFGCCGTVDATWDPMTLPTKSAAAEADDLMKSLSKTSSRETDLHFGTMPEEVRNDSQKQLEFYSADLDFEKLLPDIKASPLPLPSDETFEERAIQNMLRASTDEAEKGFDYGVVANKSTTSLPWYECGELASSMLLTDGYVDMQPNSMLVADSLTLTASVSDADWSEIAAIANAGFS